MGAEALLTGGSGSQTVLLGRAAGQDSVGLGALCSAQLLQRSSGVILRLTKTILKPTLPV